MKIIDVDTVGAYVIFCHDQDEEGDIIIVDEIWRLTFDECFKEVARLNLWGCPIEICQCLKPLTGPLGYKTVARSASYAEILQRIGNGGQSPA